MSDPKPLTPQTEADPKTEKPDLGHVVETALEADPELAYQPPGSAPKASAANTIKLVIDLGAPLAFGLSYFLAKNFGKFTDPNMPLLIATGVLMVASLLALIAAFVIEKRLAKLPMITAAFALVFGGLTLILHEQIYIQIKVTVQNIVIGSALLIGALFKKNPLKALMGEVLPLKDEAWRTLTIAYGLFFLAVAGTNEIIRQVNNDFWVVWRSSLFFVTLGFSLCLTPYLMKHMKTEAEETPKDASKN